MISVVHPLKLFSIILLTCASLHSIAGTVGEKSHDQTAYITIGSGGSYSMKANIYANPTYWDAAPQGYDASMGATALYSAAFGYRFSKLVSADVEYIYRPSYSYSRYQSPSAPNAIFFVGDVTRHFNLASNSLMTNLYFSGSGLSKSLVYYFSHGYQLEPFVGGGLGVAFNNMTNFKSLKPAGLFVSYALDNARTSLSAQGTIGLRLYSEAKFLLESGYRYYNGGTFTSENFVLDGSNILTPWKGTVQANEFFIRIGYVFG